MVTWTERFATGNAGIDLQHRMLIDNINQLEGMLVSTNPTREQIKTLIHLIDFIESYADLHFNVEEQCMERYRFPAHQKNKEAHEQFRIFLSHFKEAHRVDGFRPEVLKALHDRISAWIQEHILQIDTQLRPCIKLEGG